MSECSDSSAIKHQLSRPSHCSQPAALHTPAKHDQRVLSSLPNTYSRLEQLSFRGIRHVRRLERPLKPPQQRSMLGLRPLKHRQERFARKPALKLASPLIKSSGNTSSPPDRLAHPGVHRKAPCPARLGKKHSSSSVPANCETPASATLTTASAVGR